MVVARGFIDPPRAVRLEAAVEPSVRSVPVRPIPPNWALATGVVAGIVIALIGWGPVVWVWPLVLVPLLVTRKASVAALAIFGCLLTIITISQLGSAAAVMA